MYTLKKKCRLTRFRLVDAITRKNLLRTRRIAHVKVFPETESFGISIVPKVVDIIDLHA